jgi:hypothetical protein
VAVIDALRGLAEQVAVTERIARRTADRAALEVVERMADVGMGMVVHPSTIRDRAAAVIDARAQRAQADQVLAAHDEMVAAGEAAPPAPPAPPPPPLAPIAPPRKRGLRGFLRRGQADRAEAMAASSERLRSIAASTDDVFGARRASAEREEQRALLVARTSMAIELVRVAEHAWYDLAGEGADPSTVDDVVRRLDPQHQDALLAAQEMVSVRAASTVFDQAMTRWQSAWEELGLEAPPATDAEMAITRLADGAAHAVGLLGVLADQTIDLTDDRHDATAVDLDGSLLADA